MLLPLPMPPPPTLVSLLFMGLFTSSGDTITVFLQRAKSYVDALATAGRPISNTEMNVHIICAIRPMFPTFIPTLMDRSDQLTFEDFHGLLLSHEFLIEARDTAFDAAPSLNTATIVPTSSSPTPPALFIPQPRASPRGSYSHVGRGRG